MDDLSSSLGASVHIDGNTCGGVYRWRDRRSLSNKNNSKVRNGQYHECAKLVIEYLLDFGCTLVPHRDADGV
jgi:hypothetical protein